MNFIERGLLKYKLDKYCLNVKDNELDELINDYNHLLDYYLEDESEAYLHRFSFVVTHNSAFERDEEIYFSILKDLIIIRKLGLNKYLDYLLVLSHRYHNYEVDRLADLLLFLNTFIEYRFLSDESFIEKVIPDNLDVVDYMAKHNAYDFINNKHIDDYYKEIIWKYHEIVKKLNIEIYAEFHKDDDPANDLVFKQFNLFINMSYYYFLLNYSFKDNHKEIMAFLDEIYNDIPLFMDKLHFMGDVDYQEMLNYVGSLYNDEYNSKEIK